MNRQDLYVPNNYSYKRRKEPKDWSQIVLMSVIGLLLVGCGFGLWALVRSFLAAFGKAL